MVAEIIELQSTLLERVLDLVNVTVVEIIERRSHVF